MTEYKLTEDEESNDSAYGISVYINNSLVKSIPDICADKTDAEELVNMLNILEVDICHFDYVIEDFLTDFQI